MLLASNGNLIDAIGEFMNHSGTLSLDWGIEAYRNQTNWYRLGRCKVWNSTLEWYNDLRSTFNERYRGGWVVGCLDSRLFTTVRVQSSIRCCLLSIFKAPRHLSFPNSCETLIFIDYRVKKCTSALSFKWRIEVSFDCFFDKLINSFLPMDIIIIDLSGVAVYCSQIVDEVISKWGNFRWEFVEF